MRYTTSLYFVAILFLLLFTATANGAALITQNFDLHPGWNALYLEGQPDPADPETVFGGIAEIESVWTRSIKTSSAEFIDDPANGLGNKPGWLAYYPKEVAELSTLKKILVNRPYLVKLTGAANKTLTVSGVPKVQSQQWTTDAFNFVGFHIDPNTAISFETFMAPSAALKGRIAYRLSAQGIWTIVDNPAQTMMRSGDAYWMYAEGASKYSGPLNVEISGGKIVFNTNLTSKTVTLTNLSGSDKSVLIRTLDSYPDKIVYKQFNSSGFHDYYDINSMPPVAVGAGKSATVTLYMQTQKTPATLDTIMTISDSAGVLVNVAVSVED